ncbi:MAG: YkoF family thiamine/hydroxymethylpyrimidine-binding protein [Halieaceae bacterium]|jgi:uncharacterized protein YqgV (UPF0045/DUF77 family)
MKLTAELSLYPLREDFKTPVRSFIEKLLEQEGVLAVTNSMSTQISGEDHAVFAAIQEALRASYAEFGRQVLVAKLIPEHFADIGPTD